MMRCLSLWQPWASLCVIGAKRFETRHWSTLYRGPLLIHAAKKFTNDLRQTCLNEPFRAALKATDATLGDIPRGGVIGVVDLVAIWRTHDGPYLFNGVERRDIGAEEYAFGNYAEGRYAWELKNPRRFTTAIPYRGLQQLFNVPDELVAEQMAKARAA